MTEYPKWFNRIVAIAAVLITALVFVMPQSGIAFAETEVKVPVKVSFSGTGLPEETFRVELISEATGDILEEAVTLSAGKTSAEISFDLGSLAEGNTYTYELREVKGTNKEITYDGKVYMYYVSIDHEGVVEQRAISKEDPDDKPEIVEFINIYRKVDPVDPVDPDDPDDPIDPDDPDDPDAVIGDPPVRIRKNISLNEPPGADRFVFIMRPEKPDYPLPDVAAAGSGVIKDGVAEIYLTGEGEIEIGNITFTREGTYRYFVSEKDTAIEGYNYDDARFTVTYEVSRDQDGKLTCERTITKKNSGQVDECAFDNIYHPSKVIRKLNRGVKTGDPAVMWPVTAMIVTLILMIAIAVDRRNRREYEAGIARKGHGRESQ